MKNDSSEYLPADEERGQQHNNKVFRLAPVQDDLTVRIIGTRQEVLEHGKLTDGARVLFCWLLDNSLRWTVNRARGVITVSTTKLSERLKRSKRAIYNWRDELVDHGFIWMTEWSMPNTWPILTYHVSVIDPPSEQLHQIVTGDGMWGNHARRRKLEEPGTGAREAGQLPLSNQKHLQNPFRGTKRHAMTDADFSKAQQNATEGGTEGAPSAANFATGSVRSLRLGAARNDTGQSQETASGSRKKRTLAVAQNAPCQRQETAYTKETGVGEKRVSEGTVCVRKASGTHTMPEFEPLDQKLFPRLRPAIGDKIIERCNAKIFSIEQSRSPVPNRAEVIAAYKQRIKEAKNWVAGQL